MGYVEDLREKIGHQPLILVGVAVLIRNSNGQLLMTQKPSGDWSLPGGLMELGESAEETGRREVREETGLRLGSLALYDVISGRDQYRKLANGDEFYGVTILLDAGDIGDVQAEADGCEAITLRYFALDKLPSRMNPRIREAIQGQIGR
ncbi:NUDIX hydrolase [Cohnella sp. AR92]|uniref:NUDIX hydrolase n=1 Tax=Cohnella sp. AR92 TaxID=648716 RepID=UPI000F8CB136|nr:NUDIX domain-containing protein [Cohnella sp. AR92]RUS45815.1 NUDIX domain-containing protein [Cohnella sp. AR92]